MKKIYFIIYSLIMFAVFSCSNETQDDIIIEKINPSAINKNGEVDGVAYSLNNVVVNQGVLLLNSQNTKILNSSEDSYKVEINNQEIADKLTANSVIYFNSDGLTFLKTVKTVNKENNVFELTTTDAALGELFSKGSIEMSIDVQKAEQILKSKNALLKASVNDKERSYGFEVLNFIEEYKDENMIFNFNSSLKAFFNIKIAFNSDASKVPNEVVFDCEIKPVFNPSLSFTQPTNKKVDINFIKLVPNNLMDLLKSIEIDIDLPLGSLGTLPAKVSVQDIQIPAQVIANIYQAVDLKYSTTGSFKIGYAYYNNVPGKNSHIIYENNIVSTNPSVGDLTGEVISDAKVVIIPKIKIINETLLGIHGEIIYGLKTESTAGVDYVSREYTYGTKGDFYSSGVLNVSSLGINLFSVDLFQSNKELWNIGTFDRTIALSNIRIAKPSKVICALRSYNFEMTMDYQYPIIGKKIPGEIEISYDVYDDAKRPLSVGQVVVINPYNLTDKSFTFNLCVPFKIDTWAVTSGFTKKTGYIRNLKIKDTFNNVGVYVNEIALGSPYNTSFWR